MGSLLSCGSDAPTATPIIGEVGLAKGGGNTGGGGSAPTVTATDPTEAVQDTTIDVNVFGTGFTSGAKATWSLNGDTTKVHVKSTKVVSSTQVVAQIEVPKTAPVARYDVVVTLTTGKKGVGAELFQVKIGDPSAEFWFPLDDAVLDIRSDRQFVSGSNSVYAAGVCGVTGRVFAGDGATGDATMDTDQPYAKDRKCAVYPRTVTVVFGPGDQERGSFFMNVRQMQNASYPIPIGTTDRHGFSVNEPRCGSLRWLMYAKDGTFLGADSVNVTRVDASTWLVETQPYPNNKAYCNNTGQLYHLSVRLTVVADRPMP